MTADANDRSPRRKCGVERSVPPSMVTGFSKTDDTWLLAPPHLNADIQVRRPCVDPIAGHELAQVLVLADTGPGFVFAHRPVVGTAIS